MQTHLLEGGEEPEVRLNVPVAGLLVDVKVRMWVCSDVGVGLGNIPLALVVREFLGLELVSGPGPGCLVVHASNKSVQ